ncbi:transglycosylase SLT domain-containing protein [Hydrogenivirga sp.]
MRVVLSFLILVGVALSQIPAEYKLLKQFRETRDVKVGLFLLDNYPDAVFKDELKLEVAELLLEAGDEDRANFVLIGVNLDNVRDVYGEKAARLWRALWLDPKALVLRFPEYAIDLIPRVELTEEEKERVFKRLIARRRYEEVLRLSDRCIDKGIALFRLRRYEDSLKVLLSCDDERSGVYVLLSYIKLGDYETLERFINRRDDGRLYFKYAWHLLSRGELLKARRNFIRAGFEFEPLFYVGLIDYIRGRYRLAYENFSEAERYAKGNLQRARANFWKFKSLSKLGVDDLALFYLKETSRLAGFYSSVAKRLLGYGVYEPTDFKSSGEPSQLGERLAEIGRLGFLHYMRLEAFDKLDELTPEDILLLLSVDPYLAIKAAVRAFGANSDLYRSVAFPTPFRASVQRASERFGIPPALIYAVMRQESLFDVLALSRSGAKGLMQLIDRTAKWKAERLGITYENLFDVETNVTLGTAYLRFLMDFWKGDLVRVVASYNAGQGAVKRWEPYDDDFLFIETIPYDETRNYVRRVLWFYYVYSEKLLNEAL